MSLFWHFANIPTVLKSSLEDEIMNDYVERLTRVGMSAHEAFRFVFDFWKNFTVAELEEFVTDMERDAYVGRI